MAVALGKTPEEERKENLHQLSEVHSKNIFKAAGCFFLTRDSDSFLETQG